MTVPEKAGKPRDTAPKKTWRYRIGLVLFIASFPLFYAILIVVPFLDMPAGQTALTMTVLLVLVYGLWLLSFPLIGRNGFGILRGDSRSWWARVRNWIGGRRN